MGCTTLKESLLVSTRVEEVAGECCWRFVIDGHVDARTRFQISGERGTRAQAVTDADALVAEIRRRDLR